MFGGVGWWSTRFAEAGNHRPGNGERMSSSLAPPRDPPPADNAHEVSQLFDHFQQRLQADDPSTHAAKNGSSASPRDSVGDLVGASRFLASTDGASAPSSPVLPLPETGDEIFGFRLRHELGRGAFARVFLAEQATLAGRPVVLKISALEGQEPQTLAQLQHTHVVPVYSVHEDARVGLRALCMPYFGGASLSAVLHTLWSAPSTPVRGQELVGALQSIQAPRPESVRSPSTEARTTDSATAPLAMLSALSYWQASAWIVARLAEALHHAHQRGVLHRDIKPSNVLLGSDAQPMLLDFNLAHSRHDGPVRATLGGTVAYMAPEHLRALANPVPEMVARVDHRSDIYSLGMVLYQMLVGQNPFEHTGSYSVMPVIIEAMAVDRSRSVPSLKRLQPHIPWSLESIVRKCLAPDPAQRYQHAEHLAEDLRRFLEDEPLRYAPELSQVERVRKWLRRHPRLTSSAVVGVIAAVLLIGAGIALLAVRQHLTHTRNELQASQDRDRRQAFESGTARALCLVNTISDGDDHLADGRMLCEQTLDLYDILKRDDWQAAPAWTRLEEQDRQRLAPDARELLLLLAWTHVRSATGQKAGIERALALIDRAEAIAGLPPSRALWLDRATFLERAGEHGRAEAARRRAAEIPAVTAGDHYLLATAYARQGGSANLKQAVSELDQALALNPRHYWSCLQRGICYHELGENTLAVGDFGACIGLWPDFAWGYFNRACILQQTGKQAEAIADYSAALECDPGFVLAYLNRGLAHLELKEPRQALADFDQAAARGRDDAFLHAGRGMSLEAIGRASEADKAFAAAFARAKSVRPRQYHRILCSYAFAVAARLPKQAASAFDTVLKRDPFNEQALYGQGMLQTERGDLDGALESFTRILNVNPACLDARRCRAVLLARRGHFDQAGRDINTCLDREPTAGITLYAAACVAARAAEKSGQSLDKLQAVRLLQKAFEHGYGRDRASSDPDLAALRSEPLFRQLVPLPHKN